MGKLKSAKGKSKKITWKKIKHDDVDDYLIEKAEDERLGLSGKRVEEHFFLDFDDDFSSLAEKKRKEVEEKRTRRRKDGDLVELDKLRCFAILKPDSVVKDPVIKRNPVKKGGLKKTLDMKLKDEIRYFKKQEGRRESSRMAIMEASSCSSEIKDLWADSSNASDKILNNEWLSEETKRNIIRRPKSTRRAAQREMNSVLPVETPHPGLSINPSFIDHQKILAQAVEQEQAKLKKEQKLLKATRTTKVDGDGTLPEIKDEPENEEEEDDDDKSKVKKLPKPKTKQQKRKERERKEHDGVVKDKKELAKKESQIFRVKSLKKEIQKEEEQRKTRLVRKMERKKQQKLHGVRQLSKFKFQEKEDEPLLSTELPKGLLGAHGSTADLLIDRFKSLQKRNVIETRIKQRQKPKYKPKVYVRDSDKMEWEKTGVWNGIKLTLPQGRRRRQRNH